MIHDKIILCLKEVHTLKDAVKDVKKDIKKMEKIEDADYLKLKETIKDLKKQQKTFEEDYLIDLEEDNEYAQLRELKVSTEEKLALELQKLFDFISQLPQESVNMKTETETGLLTVDIQPEMRVYLNGKEQKPKF